MGIYKYMFNSGNQEEILNYCNETLRKLEEYDHANGTALQETLLSYYINGFNAGKTAEALFIHRQEPLDRRVGIASSSQASLETTRSDEVSFHGPAVFRNAGRGAALLPGGRFF